MPFSNPSQAVILGAGPAGLGAAYEMARTGIPGTVVEQHDRVGGLCRTLESEGYRFDIGGHRFLSRCPEINRLWREVLGPELGLKGRKSRIYYKGKFYDYPLKPWGVLRKIGVYETGRSILSYLAAQLKPGLDEDHFEGWMIRRFGRRLYENFFRSYTEKVWGIPCTELSSDWASQRIQQLSLHRLVTQAFSQKGNQKIKSLSESFLYPRLGPGQFCERLRELAEAGGILFSLNAAVREIHHDGSRIQYVIVQTPQGWQRVAGEFFLSSIPLSEFVMCLRPQAPRDVIRAAESLRFRSFISVNLIFDRPEIFEDHWLYIHTPQIRAGRVQNFKNWSDAMVPDPDKTSLGVEYFVTKGDDLWSMCDEDLIRFAVDEMDKLGLVGREHFVKGFVVCVSDAYPVYQPGYQECAGRIRTFLEGFVNLQVMGRAGLFRYNNTDHALLTGLYGARNLRGGAHDLWSVDPDRLTVPVL